MEVNFHKILLIFCYFQNNINLIFFTLKNFKFSELEHSIYILIPTIFIYCRLYSQALVKDICPLFFSRKFEKNVRTCNRSHEIILHVSDTFSTIIHHVVRHGYVTYHISMLPVSHFFDN